LAVWQIVYILLGDRAGLGVYIVRSTIFICTIYALTITHF